MENCFSYLVSCLFTRSGFAHLNSPQLGPGPYQLESLAHSQLNNVVILAIVLSKEIVIELEMFT